MEPPKKVFVSYSWDSAAHLERVRVLVDRLLEDGIDCVLDQYEHPPPPQGWPTWMREQVKQSDYVLVVCSEGYNQKADGQAGSGVRFESVQVLQELYERGMWNERVLPVLLEPAGPELVWEPLRPYHHYRAHSDEGYEELYRRLTRQPALVKPKLGSPKVLPPRNAKGPGPAWASSSGEDRFGRWAAFEIEGVLHRLRWIQPGTFWMGSPEGEAGRFEDEGPRHLVTLTEGYWLGETPCTQALWQVVMGKNPSRFQSPDRPVESVSWDDCQEFLKALNERLPRLEARLPTEAEWERACRAGTETATWVGDLQISKDGRAPVLEKVAWYAGNSGGDTHPVGLKEPNPWGLHDLLGNVWEWCADSQRAYDPEPVTDPKGLAAGSYRVIRGGSWLILAGLVRAAARAGASPGYRSGDVGFRLARGQGTAPG